MLTKSKASISSNNNGTKKNEEIFDKIKINNDFNWNA